MKTPFNIKTDDTGKQLYLSVLCSSIAFSSDFAFYYLLTEGIGTVPHLLARFISYSVGMTISYFLSVKFIFNSRNVPNRLIEYGGFVAVGMIGAAENIGLMAFFENIAGLNHLLANVIAGSIVFFFNFFGRKLLLFRKSRRNKP